jgi:hypothetical protein
MVRKKKTTAAKKGARRTAVDRVFPPAGTTLIGRYRGKEHRAIVVEQDGRLQVRLGRATYGSLSAAAKAITGGSVNGWRFWAVG